MQCATMQHATTHNSDQNRTICLPNYDVKCKRQNKATE